MSYVITITSVLLLFVLFYRKPSSIQATPQQPEKLTNRNTLPRGWIVCEARQDPLDCTWVVLAAGIFVENRPKSPNCVYVEGSLTIQEALKCLAHKIEAEDYA